jgi:hypothetical protein
VRHGGPVHENVVFIAEVKEFLPRELGAAVGDDCVGYAEMIVDVGENATTSSKRMFTIGRASIHLENFLTATRRCVKPPGACRSGPTMSRCHAAKGHVMGMV